MLNITVSDANADTMNISWLSNSSGSWQVFGTNTSVSNGTYHQNFSNATENGKWWYWKVNVTDGTNYTESSVYKFYTGCQSKINNTGSTNISGYLSMQLQYYCEPLDRWVVVNDTVNEATPRSIDTSGYLALDTIFNGLLNVSNINYPNGTYRIYVSLRDPNGEVLKSDDDEEIAAAYNMTILRPDYHGWGKLFGGDGFGRHSNAATRGVAIYKDELYIGTQNHNKSKILTLDTLLALIKGFLAGVQITMADGSYKNIEDIEVGDIVKAYDIGNDSFVNASVSWVYNINSDWTPDSYLKFNNKLSVSPEHILYVNDSLIKAKDAQVGDYFTDVNGSSVNITSIANMSERPSMMYNFIMALNGSEEPLLPSNLTYFAEDVQVYPWGSDDLNDYCFDYGFPIINNIVLTIGGNIATQLLVNFVCEISDGCELWKYNYTDNEWTELVGNTTGEADLPSGFGDYHNAGIGDMIEFNGKLYVTTGHNLGCEIWRYDGSTWEQVVGENETAFKGRGFDDPYNFLAATMKIFTNSSDVTHLYVGTININWSSDGFCQIWRTTDGENWSQVVDKGFRDNKAHNKVRNAYLWSMEEFQGKLYAGTFNVPLPKGEPYTHRGCQLWRSGTGNSGEWEKVNTTGASGNGFGEHKNYGIRKLVNWSNNLYAAVAASALQTGSKPENKNALEIWKYNGTGWTCIVGNGSGKQNEWDDGFDDFYNKYPWSIVVVNNTMWIGTLNQHIWPLTLDIDSKGCEVWCYNGTNLTPSVESNNGEMPNGFKQWSNRGARSMIEYPTGSGNIVVGTATLESIIPSVKEEGCEIWMWYP
jgi:hypothetical protein